MGPIGYPEMVFIFILALLLFGPKKLPELGKMLGKGLTEFNRAKNELKSTFDREMRDLERETQSIKEVTDSHFHDNYNYDYSSYDPGHEVVAAGPDMPAIEASTTGASATQGAESPHTFIEHAAAEHVPPSEPAHTAAAPEGTIAHGSFPQHASHGETAEQTVAS